MLAEALISEPGLLAYLPELWVVALLRCRSGGLREMLLRTHHSISRLSVSRVLGRAQRLRTQHMFSNSCAAHNSLLGRVAHTRTRTSCQAQPNHQKVLTSNTFGKAANAALCASASLPDRVPPWSRRYPSTEGRAGRSWPGRAWGTRSPSPCPTPAAPACTDDVTTPAAAGTVSSIVRMCSAFKFAQMHPPSRSPRRTLTLTLTSIHWLVSMLVMWVGPVHDLL